MSWEAIDPSILVPAFVAGILVLSTHVPLGRQVLRRGIIFIDLAVAQTAGLGAIGANLLHLSGGHWGVQAAAVGAAVTAALVLTWTEREFPDVQEALIGILFVLAATGGILLLSSDPHAGEQLKDLLVGQILWVSFADLWPVALLYTGVLAIWLRLGTRLSRVAFYLLFAITVTASVQLVGVYLVFASLIVPAVATRRLDGASGVIVAFALSGVGYAVGLVLSALLDLPTGAIIVWSLAGVGMAVMAGIASWQRAPRPRARLTTDSESAGAGTR